MWPLCGWVLENYLLISSQLERAPGAFLAPERRRCCCCSPPAPLPPFSLCPCTSIWNHGSRRAPRRWLLKPQLPWCAFSCLYIGEWQRRPGRTHSRGDFHRTWQGQVRTGNVAYACKSNIYWSCWLLPTTHKCSLVVRFHFKVDLYITTSAADI